MDEVDLKVLEELRVDGRKPFQEIGDAVGVTADEVGRRVAGLRESGLLTIVGFLNVRKLGFNEVHYHIAVDAAAIPDVMAKLRRSSHVRYAARVSGPRPLYLNCLFADDAEQSAFERGLLAEATGKANAEQHAVEDVFVASYDYSLLKGKGG